jgi:hypothetical protein
MTLIRGPSGSASALLVLLNQNVKNYDTHLFIVAHGDSAIRQRRQRISEHFSRRDVICQLTHTLCSVKNLVYVVSSTGEVSHLAASGVKGKQFG